MMIILERNRVGFRKRKKMSNKIYSKTAFLQTAANSGSQLQTCSLFPMKLSFPPSLKINSILSTACHHYTQDVPFKLLMNTDGGGNEQRRFQEIASKLNKIY